MLALVLVSIARIHRPPSEQDQRGLTGFEALFGKLLRGPSSGDARFEVDPAAT